MMTVTSAELTKNINKYLNLLGKGDIIITENGKKIAKIIKEKKEEKNNLNNIRSLYGILKSPELSKLSDVEVKKIIREERNKRYDGND
ncbi:MAG: type II toxin-antitoxin system Phd/YefM family antitoxin [Oscillospiraceae bacterium]|nr:type II toxin-antitoxin system Phd/YefM family antitoxin [Oscillospiraceae bacterium]